jgi:ABC-2 type transport system permease protein
VAQIRGQAQYRASFVMEMVGQSTYTFMDFAAVLVLFRVTPAMGGFGLWQVLLISGLAICGFSAADLAVGNVEQLRQYVRTGLLDAMLIRPRRVLPQLLAIDFQLRRVGRVVFAVVLVAVACAHVGVDWTWWRVLLVVGTPIAAAVFYAGIFVLTASVAFWWIDSGEFANSFTYGGREFATYPITIYGSVFRRVFAFGIGFAFISYYPALAIMDTPDPLGMPAWFGALGPAAAAVMTAIAALVWRTGLRHYEGTGS